MIDAIADTLSIPSPIEEVSHPILTKNNIKLSVKREDLIHPVISGNKWRKLKYHLIHIANSKNRRALTFGGAFSNHICAFAQACKEMKIDPIVIVRGEEDIHNPTLRSIASIGAKLIYMDRTSYRKKDQISFLDELRDKYDAHIIPEGGSSSFSISGIKECAEEINMASIGYDHLLVSAGTGCTAGNLINFLNSDVISNVEVFSALKGEFIKEEIKKWIERECGTLVSFDILIDYHHGGYAKANQELVDFINDFRQITGISIDPIYNGKLVYGLFERIENGVYPRGSHLLWIHTGGLQGIEGFNYRWKGKYFLE